MVVAAEAGSAHSARLQATPGRAPLLGGPVLEFDPHVTDEKAVPPPPEFSKRAHVKSLEEYRKLYAHAQANPEEFWAEEAKRLDWFEPPKQTLDWKPPHAKWFVGGKLNVSHNCVDRHLEKNANKPALLWEAEDGSTTQLTYAELHTRVCRFANALKSLGVKAGGLRHHLYADDPRVADCHARLRADRCRPFGDFRWIQRHCPDRPHRRLEIKNIDHR